MIENRSQAKIRKAVLRKLKGVSLFRRYPQAKIYLHNILPAPVVAELAALVHWYSIGGLIPGAHAGCIIPP